MKTRFRHTGLPLLTIVMAAALTLAGCEPTGEAGLAGDPDRTRLGENENYMDFGDYVLHVIALGTDELEPETAKAAGIVRSSSRGMINVVVLRKIEAAQDEPASAEVIVSAANLAGQLKEIPIRKVVETGAIYYIGDFSVTNRETLVFDVDATPEGETQPLKVRYSRKFYTK